VFRTFSDVTAVPWIAVAYFVYLAAVSLTRPRFRRARAPLLTAAAIAGVSAAIGLPSASPGALTPLRDIVVPSLVLLAGYWLSGLLFTAPNRRLEQWLLSVDDALLGRPGLLARFNRAPRAMVEYFELSYLLVYPIVPAGVLTLALGGHAGEVGRLWATVLLSEFICYGMLPWLPTRPPRVVEGAAAGPRRALVVRPLNLAIANRASIQANTLPSGHAAGAFAVALAVGSAMPAAGAVFMVLAISISIAAVVGRYHYAVDSILGVLLAFLVWAVI
jgi:membrane-associated phospholipid phosphatase